MGFLSDHLQHKLDAQGPASDRRAHAPDIHTDVPDPRAAPKPHKPARTTPVRPYALPTPGQQLYSLVQPFRALCAQALACGSPFENARYRIRYLAVSARAIQTLALHHVTSPGQAEWIVSHLAPALDDLRSIKAWPGLESFPATLDSLGCAISATEMSHGVAASYLWHHPGPYDVSRFRSPTTPTLGD